MFGCAATTLSMIASFSAYVWKYSKPVGSAAVDRQRRADEQRQQAHREGDRKARSGNTTCHWHEWCSAAPTRRNASFARRSRTKVSVRF